MDEAQKSKIERRLNALLAADFEKFNAGLNASSELCNALKEDFRDALERFVAEQTSGFARRALVRCFGSLIDGVTASMRFAAIALCQTFGEPLNPFLQEKTDERHISTHQRIYSEVGGELVPAFGNEIFDQRRFAFGEQLLHFLGSDLVFAAVLSAIRRPVSRRGRSAFNRAWTD